MTRLTHRFFGLAALLLMTACGLAPTAVSEAPTAVATATSLSAAGVTAVPISTATSTATPLPAAETPTASILPTSSPTPPPATATSPPPAADLSITPEHVFLYPVPAIYGGDRVTFQVLAHVPPQVNAADVTVDVLVDYSEVARGTLSQPNLAGDAVGLFEWAWDTADDIGEHLVHVILDRNDVIQAGDENRDNNQVALLVMVNDPVQLPQSERNATWVTANTACCHVHVVSGTAAYRELPNLLTAVDSAFEQASTRLEEPLTRPYDVYLIDRVIGQGGYAGDALVVSYLDRQYASRGLDEVLVHEAIHVIDRQFAPERIAFLAEGLAVWASGGHYKPENLTQRSAALMAIGQYIPLAQLIDNFYPVQHEIGYLEAAGFVQFLIDTYGWSQFRQFYSEVTAQQAPALSQAVDLKLQQHFGIDLATAERNWSEILRSTAVERAEIDDLETTLRFYNTMRRYQLLYDPTAYFLTAWLPYPEAVQQKGNPADLTRHPQAEINVTLEVMLQSADVALRSQDYNRANVLLDSVTRVLDNNGEFIDPLSVQYLGVVRAAAVSGYEVQQVTLLGERAQVLASLPGSTLLSQLDLVLSGQDWILVN